MGGGGGWKSDRTVRLNRHNFVKCLFKVDQLILLIIQFTLFRYKSIYQFLIPKTKKQWIKLNGTCWSITFPYDGQIDLSKVCSAFRPMTSGEMHQRL